MVDFYSQVPKDLEGNLAYRIELRTKALADERFRAAIRTACREDVLFFFNTFCFLFEPRKRMHNGMELPRIIPFITWAHQDPVIRTIRDNLGVEDIGLEKSRGEGASWIAVLLALHDWLFNPMTVIGLVSRNEIAVDNPDDPDSLMWKLDWELQQLPRWMSGTKDTDFKRTVQDHNLKNLRNGSVITGYAATGDVASGGRKAWFLMDELAKFPRGADKDAMASTQQVTECRLLVSTPKGAEGAYFEVMHEASSMVKCVLDWKDNVSRNRGLYMLVDGKPQAVDPVNNPLPDGYATSCLTRLSQLRSRGFKVEGRLRSPWYDHECDRPGATPQNIAQELDRDYGGSMFRIFGADFFVKAEEDVRPIQTHGMIQFDEAMTDISFDLIEDGPMHLWMPLSLRNDPPKHQFVVGADVSSGLGGSFTSNSVLTAIDMMTMEQVLEYATNSTGVADFADIAIATCRWLQDAYLIWEVNGPGAGFTPRVKSRGYQNVFMRELYARRGRKKTKDLGWWTDERSKEQMFSELSRSVKRGELKLRSDAVVKECGQYVRLGSDGKITHIQAATTQDDSSKGRAHGDRVIALGVCLQGVRDRPMMKIPEAKLLSLDNPPPNTPAERLKEYLDSQRQDPDGWDDRTNADLIRSIYRRGIR